MQLEVKTDRWKQHHNKMIQGSVKASAKPQWWKRLRNVCNGAKGRCTNGNLYYGGRGIEFRFSSPAQMVKWIVDNLGPPQNDKNTIDRIDTNGHYEPGNLRWATIAEQMQNKREYVGSVYGTRLRELQKIKPEFSYETLRSFIRQGMTNEQIIGRKKTSSGRPRIRYPELRP